MNVNKILLNSVKSGQNLTLFGVRDINTPKPTFFSSNKTFHVTSQMKYPQAKNIPLPNNIEAIMSVEIGQFSPLRSRDISGPVISTRSIESLTSHGMFSKPLDQFVEKYDCKGAVSLNSSMQSNVPSPFQSKGNTMYLNMPGGQWEQGQKLISEDMQNSHYLQYKRRHSGIISTSSVLLLKRFQSTKSSEPVSRRSKLKQAIAEYGTTVLVFHVSISLISLGVCYMLVSSGLEAAEVLSYIPWIDTASSSSKVTQNAGTFLAAYAIHKVMAPIRISITLASAPLIVRYLRNIGYLKR